MASLDPELRIAIQEVCEMTVETWVRERTSGISYECHICRTLNTNEEWHADWCPIKVLRKALREDAANSETIH